MLDSRAMVCNAFEAGFVLRWRSVLLCWVGVDRLDDAQ